MGIGSIFIVFVVASALAYIFLGKAQSGAKYSPKNYETSPLLSEYEQKLFWRLKEAAGSDLVVAPQVVFGAFVQVKKFAMVDKAKARMAVAHNRGDFIICGPDFSVVAVVELDDSTHNSGKQKALDRRRDELMKAVGVKPIRYRKIPDVAQIRADLGL